MVNRMIPYIQPGSYGISTEVWRVQRDGTPIERIDPHSVGKVTITYNEDLTVKRICSIQTDDPHVYTPFTDFLMPVIAITDPEGNTIQGPQGLYVVVPSNTTTDGPGSSGTIECRDLMQLFDFNTADDARCPAGMDRGAYVRGLALEMAFPLSQIQIPDFGIVQEAERGWDPGTKVSEVMTDITTGSNWYQPWFDNRGILRTAPTKPISDIAPAWTFSNTNDASAADIEGAIVHQPNWDRLANKVTVRRVGDEENPTIYYTARNTNKDSPVSFDNLGFWRAKETVDSPDLVDKASAQAQAEALLAESAAQYVKLTLPHFPMVDAEPHQTLLMDIWQDGQQLYSGSWWRTGYTLTLDGGKTTMSSELSRVEAWR